MEGEGEEEEGRRGSLCICFGDHHTTLFDEFERLSFEIQLNRTILRRSYSAPSPAHLAIMKAPFQVQRPAPCFEPVRRPWKLSTVLRRWFKLRLVGGWRRYRRKGGAAQSESNNLPGVKWMH